MVALAAVIENIVPPAPADMVITLAAFLSHRGQTSATTVFLVTWVANVAGAGLVYGLARRFGERFFATGVGRRLLSPEAVVAVERGYLRFGLVGLFLARLLPGFRSFTAPFAGLMRLGAVRAFLPIAVASGLWYGVLVLIGARLGENWETVNRLLAGLNRTLGIVAALATAGLVAWFILARRRRRRGDLQDAIARVHPALEERALEDPAAAAVAALLLETTRADREIGPDELATLERHLRAAWRLPGGGPASPVDARAVAGIVERLEPAARALLFRRLREAAFPDRRPGGVEERVLARAARLLHLEDDASR